MNNNNEFLELVSSPLMNLDHTYRYSGTKLVEPESLSQHIVDTIMLGLKIIDKVNYIYADRTISEKPEYVLDPAVYVMKATYHDLEEVITGDIPRPLKYYDKDTLHSMKKVADEVAYKFFKSQFSVSKPHYDMWDDAKEGKEGLILKLVDTLVVANKVVKEVTLLHNYYMLRVAHEVTQYLEEMYDTFNSHSYFKVPAVDDYLLDVIHGAIITMDTITEENQDIMKNLNIYGQSMI